MKAILKKAVWWNHKSEAEKDRFLQRFEFVRYRLFYFFSYVICFFPIPLRLLLQVCGSDKHQCHAHQYGHTYDALLRRFKYKRIKLLEIGLGRHGKRLGGESLNAWQAYFPFAKIIGCDILDKTSLRTFRTKIYSVDQSSKVQLEELCKKETAFDIIIDDGSHFNAHQICAFETLIGNLTSEGIYIIEDVQTSFWSHSGWDGAPISDPRFDNTCVGYFLRLAKHINYREFENLYGSEAGMVELAKSIKQIIFEHNLIIVVKRALSRTAPERSKVDEVRRSSRSLPYGRNSN
jgi:hypothetical protein